MSNHINWYKSLVGSDTEKAASDRAGITTSTLNRQLAKGTLSEGNVIAIARAYGANPVDALVRTGFITSEEALGKDRDLSSLLSDQELIHELAMRVNSDEGAWDDTFSSAMEPKQPASVSRLHADNRVSDHDDLIARINSGEEQVAAQEATDPLEENQP